MGSSEVEVINGIKSAEETLSLWFQNNCIKVNPDKFHLVLSDRNINQLDICNEEFSKTFSEKRLGIKIDS